MCSEQCYHINGFNLISVVASPLARLQCSPLGQQRWRELFEQVLRLADQEFIREVLGDVGEQVVHHSHVALGLLHLLLSVQHNLKKRN